MRKNLISLVAAGLLAGGTLNETYAFNANTNLVSTNYISLQETNRYNTNNSNIGRVKEPREHKESLVFPWPLGIAVGYMFVLALWPGKKKESGG